MFYYIQLLRNDEIDLYILFIHWGVAEYGKRYVKRIPFKDYEEARIEFIKLFKQKFEIEWNELPLFIGNNKLRFAQPGVNENISYKKLFPSLDYSVPSKLDSESMDFFKLFLNQKRAIDMFDLEYFHTDNLMISPLDQNEILQRHMILDKIYEKHLQAEKFREESKVKDFKILKEQINELNNEYFKIVPRSDSVKEKSLYSEEEIRQEQDVLQDLLSSATTLRLSLGAYLNQRKFNPYDYVFGSITKNANFEFINQESNEFNLIIDFLNIYSERKFTCESVIKVNDVNSDKGIFYR